MSNGLVGIAVADVGVADVMISRSAGAVSESASSQCGPVVRSSIVPVRAALVRSATVLVTAQNAGGDSNQPIGKAKGIPTSASSPSCVGKGTANFTASEGLSPSL